MREDFILLDRESNFFRIIRDVEFKFEQQKEPVLFLIFINDKIT